MTENWYSLDNFMCPVASCSNKTSGNWKCAVDGTKMYIAQTGFMKCGTGNHKNPICNWSWDCGNHGDHPVNRYRKADLQGFGFALSQAVSFLNEAGSIWVAALITAIGDQFDQ